MITLVKTFKRTYVSTYASVTRARHDVVGFCTACGVRPSVTDDLALAVGEACNNAAEHGHVAGGSFTVQCSCDGRQLLVDVCDEGAGFMLAGKGESMDAEQRGVRGLGIFLMRALMDDVEYEITGTGTRVRLTKMLELAREGAANGAASRRVARR